MKIFAAAVVAAIAMAGAAGANAQQELAQKSGCLNCHAADTKKVGPAFKDIAAKYKGQADAEAKLTAQVSGAKGHPAVKASPDDVKSLVQWILAM